MISFSFGLQCLFLFVQVLCNDEMTDCGHPIKIYKDYECMLRYEDFESHVRVYCNASLIRDMQDNAGQQQRKALRGPSRITTVQLVAYPVLIAGSSRYRADFHIEIQHGDLVNVDSILLLFSTREGNEEGFVRKAAVVQHVTKLNGKDDAFVRLGCYWHYNYFLATCKTTINLEITLFKRNEPKSYGKYYFRIPFWEQYNNENDIDPCLFAPFVYVEENEESDTEVISIGSANCTRPAFVEVEQRKESSRELMKTVMIYTDDFGRGNTRLKYTEDLHYYEAFFSGNVMDKFMGDIEVSGEFASISVILISVLMPVIFIIVLVLWCLKETAFTSRNSVIFSKEKPRVKFLYNNDSKFHVYRAQTEILILFMEEHCNIIIVNDSIDFHEASKSSLLPNEFDIIVLVPFPSPGENELGDSFAMQEVKQWEGTKKDCIIMELPFWSGNHTELDELCEPFTKWKRFTLMDEFLPLLSYIQRSRSCFHRRFLCSITADDMRKKLEANSLTNEGFLFCLKEAFGHSADKTGPTLSPDGYPNLQDMMM